jgi:ubiquinone/menaquinone biosynthesis C-methylase UbiE
MFPTSFDPLDQHPYGGLNPFSPKNTEVSKALTRLILQFGKLTPEKGLLDIGCGTGRILFELKEHISPAQYLGLDCNKSYLQTLAETHGQQFKTIHIDAENAAFNPNGTISADKLSLPIEDASQELIIAFALFNHLPYEWVQAYLGEIHRILATGGLFLTTWFLISHFYPREKQHLHLTYQFDHIKNCEYHIDEKRTYKNVAFVEGDIRKEITANNLRIIEPIRYGQWVNGPSAVTGHDFIIMRKRV